MTFITVSGDAKGGLVVVAGPAGAPLLHIRHCEAGICRSTDKNCTVAVVTLENLEMCVMAESGVKGLKGNLFNIFVAFLTFTFNGEGRFPVMTGTA